MKPLSKERRKLLAQQGILSQPPLLETIPVYPTLSNNLAETSQLLPPDYQDPSIPCARFASNQCLNFGKHQWEKSSSGGL